MFLGNTFQSNNVNIMFNPFKQNEYLYQILNNLYNSCES